MSNQKIENLCDTIMQSDESLEKWSIALKEMVEEYRYNVVTCSDAKQHLREAESHLKKAIEAIILANKSQEIEEMIHQEIAKQESLNEGK
jgi:flagellar motor component MotA